jgi:hypothetical protein
MRTLHACVPIRLNQIHYLTQQQLVAANNESIRLGFSRNLIEKKVARLPLSGRFPVVSAWHHTSGEGQTNIRLELIVGRHTKDNLEELPQSCSASKRHRLGRRCTVVASMGGTAGCRTEPWLTNEKGIAFQPCATFSRQTTADCLGVGDTTPSSNSPGASSTLTFRWAK